MNFEHTEDRRMLADSLNRFVAEQYGIEFRNHNAYGEQGYAPERWQQFAELGAIGVPAILVPLPGAPGDHQTANVDTDFSAPLAVQVQVEAARASEPIADVRIAIRDAGGIMTTDEALRNLMYDIGKANESLDWIEKRDGPLPNGGYARIETTVAVVRALRREARA